MRENVEKNTPAKAAVVEAVVEEGVEGVFAATLEMGSQVTGGTGWAVGKA